MNALVHSMLAAPPLVVLIGLCAGLCAASVAWALSRSVIELPAEDRTWLDRPPALFRVLWWPTRWLAHGIDPLLPEAARARLRTRLRMAGLDYAIAPAQLLAHRVLVSTLAALLAAWLANSWNLRQPQWFALAGAAFAGLCLWAWFRDRVQWRRRQLLKTLPFFLDLITLCVEAGLNLPGALQHAASKGPPGPMRDELQRVLRDVRAGKSRADALRTFADRLYEPALAQLVSALIQAENMGVDLAPVLRAQSEQRRTERFARAEKAAMEAPVKMLFPLIACIFPCTFVVLAFPIAMRFLHMGL